LTVEDSDNVTAPVLADAVISLAVPLIVVGRAVQVSEAPDASTPSGKLPAEQFAPLAASAVDVEALPVSAAVIVPAAKLPDPSRATMADAVLSAVAVVLLFASVPVTSDASATAAQPSPAPEASTPRGRVPAEQFAGLAASAVAVPALPVIVVWSPVFVPLRFDPVTVPTAATLDGVIAPSVSVMAGVVVAFATLPDTPLAVVTDTVVTVPEPPPAAVQLSTLPLASMPSG
jgi:hypothetical protein